jgi:hypothetical protein
MNARAALTTGSLIWAVAIAACWAVKVEVRAPAVMQLCVGALICAIAFLIYIRSAAVSASDRVILGRVLRGRESAVLGWLGLSSNEAAES